MKIRRNDYQYVLEYLIRKREEGQEFVAFFDRAAPVDRDELFTFFYQDDVKEFCHEMSTDIDTYDYLAIRSAYRAMSEALKDKTLLIEKDGIVDVGLMVTRRYEQLEVQQLINNQNSKVMNQKNFEYLRDQVKYTGFGEGLEIDLKEKLSKQTPYFTMNHTTKYGNDTASSELHFSKSKQSDMYFFNSFKMSLKKEDVPDKDKMEQTFYINKGNNITLKEAYNLMSGRAVNKELTNKDNQVYNAWVQMDFKQADNNGNYKLKQYHQNYGFDLDQVLAKHPIKELGHDEHKSNLLDSLKKGNRVTFIHDGAEQKNYIEANPKFKTINIYDSNMQRLDNRQAKTEKQAEGESTAVKQDNKKTSQRNDDDGPALPQSAKKKQKKHSIS